MAHRYCDAMNRLAIAIAIALVLAGCSSSSDGGSKKNADKAPESQAVSSPGEKYFKEVASNDVDSFEKAMSLAAPGSPAEAYASHLYFSTLASGEGGTPGVLKSRSGGYSVCNGQDCTEYSDVSLTEGKVQDFALAGTKISDAAAGGTGKAVKLGNLGSAEVVASFLGPVSKTMFVTVKFSSPPSKTITTSYVAYYRGPDKRQVETTDQTGPTTIQPDSVSYNTFAFTNTGFGGQIMVKVANDDFSSNDGAVSKTLETVAD